MGEAVHDKFHDFIISGDIIIVRIIYLHFGKYKSRSNDLATPSILIGMLHQNEIINVHMHIITICIMIQELPVDKWKK